MTIFTISASSYRGSETLQVRRRSHILTVLIVFSRRLLEVKKKKRANLSIARYNFNLLFNKSPNITPREYSHESLSSSRGWRERWRGRRGGLLSKSPDATARQRHHTRCAHAWSAEPTGSARPPRSPAPASAPPAPHGCCPCGRPSAVCPRKDHLHHLSHWPACNARNWPGVKLIFF